MLAPLANFVGSREGTSTAQNRKCKLGIDRQIPSESVASWLFVKLISQQSEWEKFIRLGFPVD